MGLIACAMFIPTQNSLSKTTCVQTISLFLWCHSFPMCKNFSQYFHSCNILKDKLEEQRLRLIKFFVASKFKVQSDRKFVPGLPWMSTCGSELSWLSWFVPGILGQGMTLKYAPTTPPRVSELDGKQFFLSIQSSQNIKKINWLSFYKASVVPSNIFQVRLILTFCNVPEPI